jgi:HEAT repeat protein
VDESQVVREAAAGALKRLGDARAVNLLVATLKSPEAGARYYAVEALGALRDARALTALAAALEDPADDVRVHAAETLGRLGDGRGVKWLIARAAGKKDAQESIAALLRVMEQATALFDSESLQAVAHLDNVTQLQYSYSAESQPRTTELPVDCSQVRKFALEELMRRGVKA